jgi:uncharacterized surface anchored protein
MLVIRDASGRQVAQVVSDNNGRFSARLAPGSYQLVPQPVSGLLGTAQPMDFQVVPGAAPAPLDVSYDTGIR